MDLWCITNEQVKWCSFGSCRGPGILGILCEGEPCVPIVLLGATEDLQILLKGLIGSFASSIRLGVIRHADVLMDI